MKTGDKVKIFDIGTLAVVVQPGRNMVKIELEGESFWIGTDLIQAKEN